VTSQDSPCSRPDAYLGCGWQASLDARVALGRVLRAIAAALKIGSRADMGPTWELLFARGDI
jgi:hypothetical protein